MVAINEISQSTLQQPPTAKSELIISPIVLFRHSHCTDVPKMGALYPVGDVGQEASEVKEDLNPVIPL